MLFEPIADHRRPAFRKSEVKSLLSERMKGQHPSFRFLTYSTGVFHFQRRRIFRQQELKEALHLVFSVDRRNMHASISSRLNPVLTLTPVYNDGFINPHVDLLAIKDGTDVYPHEHFVYGFENRHGAIATMIDQVVEDFGNTAVPWFEKRWEDLHTNPLVNKGFDMLASWDVDKTMLRNELRQQIKKAKFNVKNMKHPVSNDLREKLLALPLPRPEDYDEIPRLSFELLELYCGCQIIS